VYVYLEGFPAWQKRGYPTEMIKDFLPPVEIPTVPPAEFKALLEGADKVFLVDIRDSEDLRATGTIKGSTNLPLEDLMAKHETIPKERKVLLMDLHGAQVQIAGRYLVKQGYAKVVGLAGGAKAWADAGYPVAK